MSLDASESCFFVPCVCVSACAANLSMERYMRICAYKHTSVQVYMYMHQSVSKHELLGTPMSIAHTV